MNAIQTALESAEKSYRACKASMANGIEAMLADGSGGDIASTRTDLSKAT